MRVIPPKYYSGKIPDGYKTNDFFRFDQDGKDTYGVLYSGERININSIKIEHKSSLMRRSWENVKLFFIG